MPLGVYKRTKQHLRILRKAVKISAKHRKGKTLEQICGKDVADELRMKASRPYVKKYGNIKAKKIRESLRIAHLGQLVWNTGLTKETDARVRRMADNRIGFQFSTKTKKIMSKAKEGIVWPQDVIDRRIATRLKRASELGYYHSKETRAKIGTANEISVARYFRNGGREIKKAWWLNLSPEKKEKLLKAAFSGLSGQKMSSYEGRFLSLVKENKLNYKYTGSGDGVVVIGGKIPDFINVNGKKIIVEIYCSHHIGNFKRRNYKSYRRKLFANLGYRTLFLTEKDLFRKNWELHCLDLVTNIEMEAVND